MSIVKTDLTLTEAAWVGLLSVADEWGVTVLELLEQIGKGQLKVVDTETLDILDDYLDRLDAAEGNRLLSDPKQERIPWEQIKQECGL